MSATEAEPLRPMIWTDVDLAAGLQAENAYLQARLQAAIRALGKIGGAPIDPGTNSDAEELCAIAQAALREQPMNFGGLQSIADVLRSAFDGDDT